MTTNDHAYELIKLLSAARKTNKCQLYVYAQHGRLVAYNSRRTQECRVFFHRFGISELLNGHTEHEWSRLLAMIISFQRRHVLYPPCGREAPIPPCISDETNHLFT